MGTTIANAIGIPFGNGTLLNLLPPSGNGITFEGETDLLTFEVETEIITFEII